MVLTLYKLNSSPPVRAVYMTIAALNIPDVNFVEMNLLEDEQFKESFLKLNPTHTVPTLKDDDFVIWDSHAITGYLVATYGESDSLYPKDPKKRAVVDARLYFDTGSLFASCRGALEPLIYFGEKQFRPENLEKIKKNYETTERLLASTKWLAGEELTLADICCVATISSLNEILPIDADAYPKLTAWFARCQKEDFYKKGNEKGLLALRELIKSKMT